MAGSKIYTIVGIIIFSWLAFTMLKNNFDYIKMDGAKECQEQGGEWRAYSQECILEEIKKSPVE